MITQHRVNVTKRVDGQLKVVQVEVELDVDVVGLARYLGDKAARNRSKKSAAVHGMVKAKIVETRR